jgi:hypothetical protein
MPMMFEQSASKTQCAHPLQRPRAVRISTPLCLSLVAGALALTGCHAPVEHLALVRGKVTYRGSPLPGGTIVFLPDATRGTHGSIALAEIQSDGSFTLKTNDMLGVVPGHHRVTVACHQVPYLATSPPAWRPALPAKYRDPHLSGLVTEVLPNTANSLNFDLD